MLCSPRKCVAAWRSAVIRAAARLPNRPGPLRMRLHAFGCDAGPDGFPLSADARKGSRLPDLRLAAAVTWNALSDFSRGAVCVMLLAWGIKTKAVKKRRRRQNPNPNPNRDAGGKCSRRRRQSRTGASGSAAAEYFCRNAVFLCRRSVIYTHKSPPRGGLLLAARFCRQLTPPLQFPSIAPCLSRS